MDEKKHHTRERAVLRGWGGRETLGTFPYRAPLENSDQRGHGLGVVTVRGEEGNPGNFLGHHQLSLSLGVGWAWCHHGQGGRIGNLLTFKINLGPLCGS